MPSAAARISTTTRRRATWVLAAAVACAVAYPLAGYVAASRLVGRARAPFAEPAPDGYEGLRLRGADAIELGAWWRSPAAPRAVVVLAHGNGASRRDLREAADAFVADGCAVLPVTLRAHGDSGGTRNDMGLGARRDIEAAVDFARERLPERPIYVYAVSLGAAAALFAAESLGERVAGYVLVAPYADLREAVRRRTRRYLWPGLDQLAYGSLLLGGRLALPELDRIRPVTAARAVPPSASLLVIAGTADDRAPVSDARRIAEASGHGTVLAVEGLDHDALGRLVHHESWTQVLTFTHPH